VSDARNEFIRATFALSKSNPKEWIEFCDAFSVYTQYELERALGIPLNEAQMALGMSRRMNELRNDFRGIEALAKKVGVVR
jgi:hypothetical protein